MIAANSNILGICTGYYLPSLFVKESDKTDIESAKQHLYELMLTAAVIGTVAYLMVVLFLQDKPVTPPSISKETNHEETYSLKKDLGDLMRNKPFVLGCLSCAFIIAYYYSFTSSLSTILA